MAKKILQIIETAYRATLEEQDDPVVWMTHAMKGAGGEPEVLLRGNAVNYAVKEQDASGLAFGAWKQTQPPRLAGDLSSLIRKGVNVYIVEEDIRQRGLETSDLIEGLKTTPSREVAGLLAGYDQVWHW
ncbi:MAG: hypothetical protein ACE5HD_06585 [Acidobacteriota bacterium]